MQLALSVVEYIAAAALAWYVDIILLQAFVIHVKKNFQLQN